MPVMNILRRNTAMIKVFIDTNIMVDVLLGREKFLLQSEDNLQYRSALSAGCEVIVTRNVSDFPKDGEIRTLENQKSAMLMGINVAEL